MHVAALTFDLHLPDCHSLKDKRAVVRPILDGCRRRFAVAASEVDHQDRRQRTMLAVATVSGSAAHAADVLDAVERFVWSFPEVEVVACSRDWLEHDASMAGSDIDALGTGAASPQRAERPGRSRSHS